MAIDACLGEREGETVDDEAGHGGTWRLKVEGFPSAIVLELLFDEQLRMSVEWLIPWHPVDDAEVQDRLLAEFQRELPVGHVLAGTRPTPIGRRQDCDDVLFALADGRVAIVHLTWSGKRELVPSCPWTQLFDSLERFVEDEMKPEHSDWE